MIVSLLHRAGSDTFGLPDGTRRVRRAGRVVCMIVPLLHRAGSDTFGLPDGTRRVRRAGRVWSPRSTPCCAIAPPKQPISTPDGTLHPF